MISEPSTDRASTPAFSGDQPPVGGRLFLLAAVTFFAGSAVLTRTGQPGAATPTPWMVSHLLWFVAAALLLAGTVAHVRRRPGTVGLTAVGLAALGVLHTLQWATWVYVDVTAYRLGARGRLFDPLLHPFGTGHALMEGVLVGGVVALLGWRVARRTDARWLGRAGVAVGAAAVLAGLVSLGRFAPTRSPTALATIGLIALGYAWVLLLGASLRYRTAACRPGGSSGAGERASHRSGSTR